MKLAVATCYAYRDAWSPFLQLLKLFWPDCPYPVWLLTDSFGIPDDFTDYICIMKHFPDLNLYNKKGGDWCSILRGFAKFSNEEILLVQEDFFLTAPVRTELVQHGLQQMRYQGAGSVRLYPCPGADEDYGDPYLGSVLSSSAYRVSCQATIWRPDYLSALIRDCDSTPSDFEIAGTKKSAEMPDPVLAFKRDIQPWPMEYLCSAITRGEWESSAKELCSRHGIDVNWSRRPFREQV